MTTVVVLGGYEVFGSAAAASAAPASSVGWKDVERVVVAGRSQALVGRSLSEAHAV